MTLNELFDAPFVYVLFLRYAFLQQLMNGYKNYRFKGRGIVMLR